MWLTRNDIIFRGKVLDCMKLIDVVKIRLGAVADFFSAPSKFCLPIKSKSFLQVKWEPPPCGFVKFNIDSAVNHCLGPGGIGCILWEADGKMLVSFSNHIEEDDLIVVELVVVKEVLSIFFASRMKNGEAYKLAKAVITRRNSMLSVV
ncbi:hypothetical protein J1N35_001933 [Gossypium stocksii]|uniref:RNase H type-1 domain-containing protein n=1 Tax=Gossypium stocksii TaxID=47602 RepID=A0A9D3WJN1_9ROSI|nr:hypothetical protein J1N35_001933 [Gossypium stocksii]